MKKGVLFAVLAVLMLGIVACATSSTSTASVSQNNETKDVREAIWNQLSSRDKERIAGTWKDATVSTVTLTKQTAKHPSTDKSYIGKEVYMVDFKIKKIQCPNNIAFYADKKTFKLIGMGITE
ncbi:hypothetical protein [Ectobacillus panaciterrae]|uniref:hypothetical protein n=1 Tax=Ectobacillus panaciterrae TaxID=363872 RepID=UPI00040BB455|nr:hypothetical protein [Ectobacillus panaciterrae]